MFDFHPLAVKTRFEAMWAEQVQAELDNERSGSYQPEEFYTSGRKSKEFPDKENTAWWLEKGPGFVQSWEMWRDHSGLDIWTTPDDQPAIELEVRAKHEDVEVLSFIDRVMVDQFNVLYVVDLKTGSQTPAWPQQLAFNNLGLLHTYGVWATYGGFWSARKGGIAGGFDGEEWADLRIYDEAWLWDQATKAKAIRDQQLFVAQPTNLCRSACGVSAYCKAVAGPLSLTL